MRQNNFFLAALLGIVFMGLCLPAFAAEGGGQPMNIMQSFDDGLDRLGEPISITDDVKLEFSAEFRHRFEFRDDFNFNNATFEDDGFNLIRTRLGMELEWDENISIFVQAQDSHSFASRKAHKSPGFVNLFDLHQLYVDIKNLGIDIPLSVKVGRQELSYGDQRFVGAFGWSNVARVFDAVKVVFTPKDWFKADLWFSQVVKVDRGQADSADHSDNFYGLYTTLKPLDEHVLDTFLFIRHNRNQDIAGERAGRFGPLKEYTVGNRFKGKKAGFDYGIEWAWQFGSRGRDEIQAWAWHNHVGYQFADLAMKPHISFEYNYGSGDSNPTDGKFENFDNLFPTNHIHYGYMDRASLRNMHNFALKSEVTPYENVKLMFAHHWFFLATNNSAWFSAGQGAIRPASSGASTTVGQETDLLLKWKAAEHLNFLMGYSHFHAGAFARDTGAADNSNFFYVQTVIKV